MCTCAFFLEVKNAYDTVWRDGFRYKIWEMGINGKIWIMIRSSLIPDVFINPR